MFDSIPFLYEILWASVGLVLYKFVAHVFDYGRASLVVKETTTRCLVLVGAMVEDIAFMRELKYKTMHESNIDEKEIEVIREIDEKALQTWKNNVIMTVVNSFPKEFRSIIGFSTWAEAMTKLDDFYKNKGK
jgi:hypothetical protein